MGRDAVVWWKEQDGLFCCQECGSQKVTAELLLLHLQDHLENGLKVPNKALDGLRDEVVKTHSYDDAALDAATAFLGDYERASTFDKACLAQHVQSAVEEWLGEHGFE
jgi:hypothetical protein